MREIEENKIFATKFCLQTTHQPSNKIKKIISPTWDVVDNCQQWNVCDNNEW